MTSHFDAKFFTKNRQNLLKSLGHGSLLVMTAHGQMQRAADMAYQFRQESNFWYVSGIEEPEWWLIADGAQSRTWLVRPDPDPIRTVFDGSLPDKDALHISGADTVIDRIEARRLLGTLRQRHRIAYTVRPQAVRARYGFHPNPSLREFSEVLSKFEMRDLRQEIMALRAIKQPVELEAIQRAVDTTTSGIKRVLQELPKIKFEYQAEAILDYEFRVHGANGHCFDPVVASGINTCVMHYGRNNDKIEPRSWLLLDVGAEYAGYASDVARTVPVSKQISQRYVQVYEAVERVAKKCVAYCTTDNDIAQYQEYADDLIAEELVGLGLLSHESEREKIRQYFPHAIGHGLGIDPHESFGGHKKFIPGMVLAVEPGIYIPEEGIGVRLEDDVLVTEQGPKNLSSSVPTGLEALMKLSGR